MINICFYRYYANKKIKNIKSFLVYELNLVQN